jgi:hypothetical protein
MPFRIFQFFAHWPSFDPAATILNTVFRILPGMVIYLILSLVVLLTWSIGFFIALGPYFREFETYSSSIISLFTVDIQQLYLA